MAIEGVLRNACELLAANLDISADGAFLDIDKEVIAAAIPGQSQRARVAEIVSPVLNNGNLSLEEWLKLILLIIDKENLSLPNAAALHLHFDASPLKHPIILARLISFCFFASEILREKLPPNINCKRLKPFSEAIKQFSQELTSLTQWDMVYPLAMQYELSKFFDFNIWNIIANNTNKQTFEVRLLPPIYETNFIQETYKIFSTVLTKISHKNDYDQSSCFKYFETNIDRIAAKYPT